MLLLPRSGRPAYPSLEDWVQIFRHSIESFQRTAAADPSRPPEEAAAAAQQFAAAYRVLVDEAEQRALAACSGGGGGGGGGGGNGSGSGSTTELGCLELCALRCDCVAGGGRGARMRLRKPCGSAARPSGSLPCRCQLQTRRLPAAIRGAGRTLCWR